ncbi:hypothetical protein LTR97_008058 [Elasticomyces elasticus]|uniref:AB hydrolase-1 domain-containing protein n=1 Tax=Elasticomyces elasticus TaxID=574655 RepID=A0AAN8A0N7_9PEZI|nr:hypothetical protein LTR97_008058 [Elasticomyces elasticus]
MEHFLRTWFKGAAMHEIRRDDLKEWLAWGFWNEYSASKVADQAELEEYALAVERKLGRKLKEGRGPHQPVRPSSDPINIQHRPLAYYIFGVGSLDTLIYFRSFPYRPLTTLCTEYSVAKDLSYWYRPHKCTSKDRMPLLFLHGIGIGLGTYTDFFADLVELNNKDGSHDQIGILAIEIMPISFRLTSQTLRRQEMVRQIRQILGHHGWDKQRFVLAAHSYGTVIATHMLHDPLISPRIGPVVLADPISLWVQMGDVAHNFTARVPKSASEIQLHYFACTDIGAAHAVTRRFPWTENVLFKTEMKRRQFGIVLGGRDIIMAAGRCRDYILEDFAAHEISSEIFKGGEIVRTKEMEMLWFDGLNHAEAFVFREERQKVVDMVWRYCCG